MSNPLEELLSRLTRHGNFYVDPRFDREHIGPSVAEIFGQKYYRFMDFFYLSKLPYQLEQHEVVELCNLRIDYFDRVIDLDLNMKVVRCMAQYVLTYSQDLLPRMFNVLDFGCGSGSSTYLINQFLPKASIFGVDVSAKAIDLAKQKGYSTTYARFDDPLPYENGQFDVVFAVFVMHFTLPLNSILEINRILANDGFFIFNLYNFEPPALRDSLASVGFLEPQVINCNSLPPNHRIYVCHKLNST